MVINWSNFAIDNLREFKKVTKMNDIRLYTDALFEYTENLINNNDLGKYVLSINNLEIRQLIFKKHKILYCIVENEIRILALIHESQNYTLALKYMLTNLF